MRQDIRIRAVRVIATQPAGQPLVVLKVLTTEPGLYGVGCATFTQRWEAVATLAEKHLAPLVQNRPVHCIEDTWHLCMNNGYWRNGPVQNNAISGIDQALWDIKGKLAGMPVYELLGGRSRTGALVYGHASGRTPAEVLASVLELESLGYRCVRVQLGRYGGEGHNMVHPEGAPDGAYYDPRCYVRETMDMLAYVRSQVGSRVELLHDIHERLQPIHAIAFAKEVERLQLFFLEDALAPEDLAWFGHLRGQCATPLAMGELFNHPLEWTPLIENRLIDYLRMHISQMGGITPARHVTSQALAYDVKTAWHGPGDTSPVGHAANLHLDLWAPNFGIQEWCRFPDPVAEVFPGLPEVRQGYMYSNEEPGLGIDIDEAAAAKWPCTTAPVSWTQARWPDGTAVRP